MNKPRKYTTLDLFCGAGGLALGFEHAGFRTLAGVDMDAQSLMTFSKNFPGSKAICEDLAKASPNLRAYFKALKGKVDVVVGGPPCQGFSIAGKRLIDDPRNQLYKHYIETVKLIRPKYVVMENVPTIRTMGNGRVAQSILEDLSELGYNVAVSTVNAADYGVPQNRKRTFFIGKLAGNPVGFPAASKHVSKISTKQAIDDLPAVDDHFEDSPLKYLVEPQNKYQQRMRRGSRIIFNHWSVAHTQKTRSIIALVPDGGNYKDLPKRLQGTRNVNIAWTRMFSEAPSFTIDAGHNHHFHYSANRVPTVRENARIQSFPDSFVFLGNKTSQFRQVGNAVPPLLAAKLALEIYKDLD